MLEPVAVWCSLVRVRLGVLSQNVPISRVVFFDARSKGPLPVFSTSRQAYYKVLYNSTATQNMVPYIADYSLAFLVLVPCTGIILWLFWPLYHVWEIIQLQYGISWLHKISEIMPFYKISEMMPFYKISEMMPFYKISEMMPFVGHSHIAKGVEWLNPTVTRRG